MEIFQDVLRGFYPFLLIFQILIVSGLVLTLIWFVIQRAKESSQAATAEGNAGAKVSAQGDSAAVGTPQTAGNALGEPILDSAPTALGEPILPFETPAAESAPTVQETVPVASGRSSSGESVPANLSGITEELAAKEALLKSANEEGTQLKDKIRYLESRLMEYEIVQEEISALSTLRVENEKLKEDLLKFQGGRKPDAPTAASTPPSAAETSHSAEAEGTTQGQIESLLSKIDGLTPPKS